IWRRWTSGGESLDGPGAVGVAVVSDAVVEAIGTTLPEFDAVWFDAIATPVFRPGEFFHAAVFFLCGGELRFEPCAVRDRLALGRNDGSKLAAVWSAVEIRIRFFGRELMRNAANANLAL